MTKLDAEAELLRRLVACDDFAGAEACARRYARMVEDDLKSLRPPQAEGRLRDCCMLLEWARRTLCAARAGLSAELQRVHRLAAYHQATQPRTQHTWRIEA